ncbi:MAG: SDR family NAD(P)-dependent oxidoreductase, partial [Betaproteobacteria bacterium]
MQIAGNIFFVTGAASGLGAASARMIVANGGRVVLADISDAAGTALAAELGGTAR